MSTRNRERLRAAIARIKSQAHKVPGEIQAALGNHAAILAAGYLEVSIREILAEYADDRSESSVANFVRSRLDKFTNAKLEKILGLVEEFSKDKRDTLELFAEGRVKAAVDSLVSNRHLIAHGRYSGTSLGTILGYFDAAEELVQKLEELFPRKSSAR